MVRISFIVPQQNMVDLIFETYKEQTEQYKKTYNDDIEYAFSVFVAATIKDVVSQAVDADILIARGLLAAQLREKYPNIFVIEVPISGREIILAIRNALDTIGNVPIAVLGAFNMTYAANGLDDLLNADIKCYKQESNVPAEIKKTLDNVINDNRKAIICGPNTYKFAIYNNYPCILLMMSKESIWQAISEAKHSAVIRRQEREKTIQFRTILNYAYEGIMSIDNLGKISLVNSVAEEILGIDSATCIGKYASAVLPRCRFSSILRGNVNYSDEIVNFNNYHLTVNKVGIKLNNDQIGNIITFQEVSAIQKAESKIRDKIYSRGYIARYKFENIIGKSRCLINAIETGKNYAKVNSNILIVGETGTGKELFAQSIHNVSDRKNCPFVAINCAALSKSLLESELFGYVDGAFTGAAKGGKLGLFELAHTGTIFLDEISEIPMDLQGRLLRVIQEREIMRLGDDKIIPINVRVISATNKPLLSQVRNSEFRRDLYYRLNVLNLMLPPLRERETDILLLANYFIECYCREFQKNLLTLSSKACETLLTYNWEGNIRELRNICERIAVICKSSVINSEDVNIVLDKDLLSNINIKTIVQQKDLKYIEKENIIKVLENCNYNKDKAATLLGISKTTLWRKIKEFNLHNVNK